MHSGLKSGLCSAFLAVSAVSAQVGPIAQPIGPIGPDSTIGSLAGRAGAGSQALINGMAIDGNASPLPNATVRLRNLQSNRIEQVSTTNQIGEFSFVAIPEVPYVVEIADYAGRIVAVGDVLTAQAGEVAGTVVSIPTRLPAPAGVFSDTAGAVVSAATGIGLTAVEAIVLPALSPER